MSLYADYLEHGRAPDESVRRWQGYLSPGWRRLAGGDYLYRGIAEA